MSNECVVGSCTDDGPRRSQLKSGNVFLLTECHQGEPFAYLPYDGYALRPSDAGPKGQASERSVDLAERAQRAEIIFSCS